MKYVKLFEQFEEDIHEICKKYGIENYTVNPDGSIDVDDNVILSSKRLDKLPIRFNKVSGNFWCNDNQLTTLEGCPKEVGGEFYCQYNLLTTLEGCPKEVGGDFICSNNKLTTLEGSPKEVGGYFSCHHNQLTTLEGGPKEVTGSFDCDYNKLTTLEGGPKIVRGGFDCSYNKLFKFDGSPDYVNRTFNCYYNPIGIIWDLFKDWEYVELLNDYDLLRVENSKGVLIYNRLVDFLETIKKSQPTKKQIQEIKKNYEIR